jgi:hypothetical protein
MDLNKRTLVSVVVGMALAALAVAVATLPRDWIEANLGLEPDAGSGVLELLLILVPLVLGVALLARVGRVVLRSRPRPNAFAQRPEC